MVNIPSMINMICINDFFQLFSSFNSGISSEAERNKNAPALKATIQPLSSSTNPMKKTPNRPPSTIEKAAA